MSAETHAFNYVICGFVNDMVKIARRIEKTDKETHEIRFQIQTMQTAMVAAIYAKPDFMITSFFEAVEPYHEHIFAKDDKFFLEHTIDEVESDCLYAQKIQHIRDLWKSNALLSNEKSMIWNRLSQLLRLSALYVDTDQAKKVLLVHTNNTKLAQN